MPLAAGVRLGPYEIIAPLGAGGMGEVYRAKDPRLGREVAIKVLPASFAGNEERLRRFEQEARAAGTLNHPNILAIYDTGVHDGSPYVVSELLQGQTLRDRIGQGPLPLRKAIEIAIQVARGVAAAHEKKIVHRDLKPENLFLTTDGHLKILDFGLAKFAQPEDGTIGKAQLPTITSLTQAGFVVGTIGYMSPEQVRGETVDHRSDIFSLGAILYEMLCGHQAFRGGSSADKMVAILKEDPLNLLEECSEIPPAMAHVVRHCLEKNPAERFQSASDLAFDLEALSGLTRTAIVTPVATRSRRRMLGLLGVVAILAALAAGVFIGSRQVRGSTPTYRWLAFRSGTVLAARFAPDGQTIVYSAAWEGKSPEIFTTRPESPESRSLGLASASLLAVSPKGEMAILLGVHPTSQFEHAGTLARIPLDGGSPREVVQDAEFADWAPDGAGLLVVRRAEGRDRLEFPPGKLIYETGGWIGHPRFSPRGDQIAFIDHPDQGDDIGSLATVDLAGHRRTRSTGWTDLIGLAWTASGDEVWFTGTRASGPEVLMALSLSGREREVTRVPGNLRLFDIGVDGRVLLANDNWREGIYCLARGTDKERNLSWFDFSSPDDLSADGSLLLFHEAGMAGGPEGSAYLRKTDGSPPLRLIDGGCIALSPHGDRAICGKLDKNQWFLVPTKAGETKELAHGLTRYIGAKWFPDEKRILFLGVETGHGARLYTQNIAGGQPQAITPEGVNQYGYALSPDGSQIAAAIGPDAKSFLFPTSGGDPRLIAGLQSGDWPISWSEDGRWLYTYRFGELPATISRFELATGKKTLWKQLMPAEPSGVVIVPPILVTPDGKSYAYGFVRIFSDLYVVEGLR